MRCALLAFPLLLASCASGPRELLLPTTPKGEAFEEVLALTRVHFPVLTVQDVGSGWIVSDVRYVGGRRPRRVQLFVRVDPLGNRGSKVIHWTERQVFATPTFFGLIGSPEWVMDGRDEEIEEQIANEYKALLEPPPEPDA